MSRRVVLVRLRAEQGRRAVHRVGGAYVDAGDATAVHVDLGELPEGGAWWDVPLPACPDCGRDQLVWADAGLVPGARACVGCGSHFSVEVEDDAEIVFDGGAS